MGDESQNITDLNSSEAKRGVEVEAAAKPVISGAPPKLAFTKMPEILSPPNLATYMDYRRFLLDFYEYRRMQTSRDVRPYSYSVFSAAANIKSPNYLKMIIEGKRNLSPDMVDRFAKAVGLTKDQVEEFHILVNYNQATDPSERGVHLRQLTHYRVEQQIRAGVLDAKIWDKIPSWIAWILYSMLDQEGVEFTTEKLRLLLRGKASASEIQEALKSLINSGEVTQDPITGAFSKAHNLIESPDDIPVALIRKLQTQLMYLGLESLYQDAATEREFGTLTLSLNRDEFEQVKFQLRKLRKEIHKDNSVKRSQTKGERVYQLNIQLFPVTDPAQIK